MADWAAQCREVWLALEDLWPDNQVTRSILRTIGANFDRAAIRPGEGASQAPPFLSKTPDLRKSPNPDCLHGDLLLEVVAIHGGSKCRRRAVPVGATASAIHARHLLRNRVRQAAILRAPNDPDKEPAQIDIALKLEVLAQFSVSECARGFQHRAQQPLLIRLVAERLVQSAVTPSSVTACTTKFGEPSRPKS